MGMALHRILLQLQSSKYSLCKNTMQFRKGESAQNDGVWDLPLKSRVSQVIWKIGRWLFMADCFFSLNGMLKNGSLLWMARLLFPFDTPSEPQLIGGRLLGCRTLAGLTAAATEPHNSQVRVCFLKYLDVQAIQQVGSGCYRGPSPVPQARTRTSLW